MICTALTNTILGWYIIYRLISSCLEVNKHADPTGIHKTSLQDDTNPHFTSPSHLIAESSFYLLKSKLVGKSYFLRVHISHFHSSYWEEALVYM